MSLSDQLNRKPLTAMHGAPCSVGEVHRNLPDGEREALDAMLHELKWDATQIFDALTAEGHMVSRQQINRHRRGACRCGQDAGTGVGAA